MMNSLLSAKNVLYVKGIPARYVEYTAVAAGTDERYFRLFRRTGVVCEKPGVLPLGCLSQFGD